SLYLFLFFLFFFSSRRRHTRSYGDWSSDVCSSDLSSTFKNAVTRAARETVGSEPVGRTSLFRNSSRHPGRLSLTSGCCTGSPTRSEERRVGKECSIRRSKNQYRIK